MFNIFVPQAVMVIFYFLLCSSFQARHYLYLKCKLVYTHVLCLYFDLIFQDKFDLNSLACVCAGACCMFILSILKMSSKSNNIDSRGVDGLLP